MGRRPPAGLSRRGFLGSLAAGAVGSLALAARGHEAWLASLDAAPASGAAALPAIPSAIRLNSNENAYGAAPAALEGVRAVFSEANRYPFIYDEALIQKVAAFHHATKDQILLGCGSTEILRVAANAFTSPTRAVVMADPTFESLGRFAEREGAPVTRVPLDAALRHDLPRMLDAAKGAGLVYICNPNNPTATIASAAAVADFVATVPPTAVVLIDEAYHHFVVDSAYQTAIPLALSHPNVVVMRTFSKIFGLAGLRIGYAIGPKELIQKMAQHKLPSSTNALGLAASIASLEDEAHVGKQRDLNREARTLLVREVEHLGYRVAESHANFVMIEVRRDSRGFAADCAKRGVLIGRPFPPLTNYARVSVGTLPETQKFVEVFRDVTTKPLSKDQPMI